MLGSARFIAMSGLGRKEAVIRVAIFIKGIGFAEIIVNIEAKLETGTTPDLAYRTCSVDWKHRSVDVFRRE